MMALVMPVVLVLEVLRDQAVVVVPVVLVALVSILVKLVDLVDWVFSCHLHSKILLQLLDILREILHHFTLSLAAAVVVLEVLPLLLPVVVVELH
tara:strand:+ start:68 stop:352 length:285 start_codon:yes stop_codon:yes gene_type:complete